MGKGYDFVDGIIIVDRELNELDLFVRDFLEILKKHTDYLVVSGYVSISTGRTRATEDVDIIVPVMDNKSFKKLYDDLINNGFWCYQGDDSGEIYSYLKNLDSIRFARSKEIFPNIELVPFDESFIAKSYEFKHFQKVKVKDFEFKIPILEFEILYKEIALGSDKDIEDARHLRNFFSDVLSEERFKECREVILKDEERKEKKIG